MFPYRYPSEASPLCHIPSYAIQSVEGKTMPTWSAALVLPIDNKFDKYVLRRYFWSRFHSWWYFFRSFLPSFVGWCSSLNKNNKSIWSPSNAKFPIYSYLQSNIWFQFSAYIFRKKYRVDIRLVFLRNERNFAG